MVTNILLLLSVMPLPAGGVHESNVLANPVT